MALRTLWEQQLHQRPDALATTPGHVVVHERRTRLVNLDARDGTTTWDIRTAYPRKIVVFGHRCLLITQVEELRCLDIRDGSLLWETPLPSYTGHLVATQDVVLVGGWRGYTPLMCFDLKTGQRRWSTENRVCTSSPAVAGPGVLIGEDSVIRLIDPQTNETVSRWELPEPLVDPDDQPVLTLLDADRVLARCGSRMVVEFTLSSHRTAVLFRHDTDLADAAVHQAGDVLWLRERGAGYVTVDPVSGRVLGRMDLRRRLVDGVARTGSGFLVGCQDGVLFMVDVAGQVSERRVVSRRISAVRQGLNGEALVLTKGTLLAVTCDDRAS